MPTFATDGKRFGALVKHEYEPQTKVCRDSVVINDAAATLTVGAVLGKVTATGKYKLATSAATDGSQNPAAVLIADALGFSRDVTLTAATDTKVLVLVRGPVILADAALQFGTGMTLAATAAAFKALGMLVETAI